MSKQQGVTRARKLHSKCVERSFFLRQEPFESHLSRVTESKQAAVMQHALQDFPMKTMLVFITGKGLTTVAQSPNPEASRYSVDFNTIMCRLRQPNRVWLNARPTSLQLGIGCSHTRCRKASFTSTILINIPALIGTQSHQKLLWASTDTMTGLALYGAEYVSHHHNALPSDWNCMKSLS